ncbi:hypothetical protein [Archaeoglobus neptunius]|uniref:hypothetical protein n=1 Tax=Archaeoglobus neptunius TaxID=2798580 RepID=UPI0019276A7B|nr:hypothetical protein [Archaeoglobus neptunius]
MRKFVAGLALCLLLVVVAAGNYWGESKEMEVLVILPPDISAEELSDKLGVEKSDVFEYKQGYLKYFSKDAFECEDFDEVDYASAARNYLAKLKLEPKLSYEFSGIAEDGKIFAYRNGTIRKCITNKHVNFQMYYKGIKLFGPGAKVRVYFSGNGVSGVITQLWNVKAVGKVGILDRDVAVKELKGCNVKSIELVYFVPLPEGDRTYIYPAYAIRCVHEGVEIGKIVPAVPISELEEVTSGEG